MDKFKLEKPDLSNFKLEKIYSKFINNKEILKIVYQAHHPKYLYWDKVKYLPMPDNFSPEEVWFVIKNTRVSSVSRLTSVITSEEGERFSWQTLPGIDEFNHDIDLSLGGNLGNTNLINEKDKKKFIFKGVIEEAIASSQLEGANTTRKVAKEMIKAKRKAKNESEQMILNNYAIMSQIENDLKNHKLSKQLLFDIHETLVNDTIEKEDIGRFRNDADQIVVADSRNDIIYHIPPKEAFLQSEIKKLIDYANDDLMDDSFVHPVIKAIIIHFWIGYLHPFTDGNGRLARALFYWYLLKKGYWAFSFLPLSKIIKKSPSQYRDAYSYTEQDDYDLTYFIDYNIRKIKQAKTDFEKYVENRISQIKIINENYKRKHKLNDRQIQLLSSYHKNRESSTYIKLHANYHDVARLTARKDLLHLKELGLVTPTKIGKEIHYYCTDKIEKLFD